MKLDFTCETKSQINGLIEYHREILEEIHKGLTCNIIDVKLKHLTIGLIKVIVFYEMS